MNSLFEKNIGDLNLDISEEIVVFKVFGSDASSYLSGQLTNKLPKENQGNLQSLLSSKGQLDCIFYLHRESKEKFIIICDKDSKDIFLERINRFIISEDVEVELSTDNINSYIGQKNLERFFKENNVVPFVFLGELALLTWDNPVKSNKIKANEIKIKETWLGNSHEYKPRFLTDSIYLEDCYNVNKGCFPGQENLAKIYNNRGAANYPCLVVTKEKLEEPLLVNNEKAGVLIHVIEQNDQFFNFCLLKRDFRIDQNTLSINSKEAKIFLYPNVFDRISFQISSLYYQALDLFNVEDKVEDSKNILKNILKIQEKHFDAYESLGVILGREENYKEALNVFHQLEQVDPTSIMAQTNLSLYYMKVGEIEKAEEHKANAIVKEFERMGMAEEKKEDFSSQIKMFESVLEIDPEDDIALNGLGDIFFNQNDFEKALGLYEKVLEKNSKNLQSLMGKVRIFEKLKEFEMLKPLLEHSLKIAASQGRNKQRLELESLKKIHSL